LLDHGENDACARWRRASDATRRQFKAHPRMHCIAEGPTRQTARTSPATAKEHVQITPARAALDHNDDEPEAKKPAEESPPQRTTYVRAPPVAIACLNRTDRTAMMPRWLNTARHRPHYHQAPDPAGGTATGGHADPAAAASAARVLVRAARSFRRELAVGSQQSAPAGRRASSPVPTDDTQTQRMRIRPSNPQSLWLASAPCHVHVR
jgi:hypothetical protein